MSKKSTNNLQSSPYELETVLLKERKPLQNKDVELLNDGKPISLTMSEFAIGAIDSTISVIMRNILGQPISGDLQRLEGMPKSINRLNKEVPGTITQEQLQIEAQKMQIRTARIDSLKTKLQVVKRRTSSPKAEQILVASRMANDVYTEHFLQQLIDLARNSPTEPSKAKLWLDLDNKKRSKKKPFFMKTKSVMQVDVFSSNERTMNYGG